MQRRVFPWLGALAMIVGGPGHTAFSAEGGGAPAAPPDGIEFVKARGGIEQYRLKSNNMDILLLPSNAAPVVTFLVVVRVGSRNEAPGNTGSAHLLEHMLFNKSTDNFGRGSAGGRTIQEVLYEAGGDFSTSNMTTWCDRITMYDTLPADQLETTMKINADRLRRGKILDAERKPEMTVVRNEYERGENDSGEALLKAVVSTAIVAHPYHWSTIGWKSDIEGVSTDQLRQHYDTYFWPDNATAVLVGDFDRARALALFKQYFGMFPKSPKPIPKVVTVEPPQEGERRVIVRRTGTVAQVSMAWPRPGAKDPEFFAFDVLASILGEGLNSRLYQALVESRLATAVSAWNWAFMDPFLLILNATPAAGVDPAAVEAEMRKVVMAIRTGGVKPEEVARAKAQIEAQFAYQSEGTYGTASALGESIAASDWEWWVDYLDRIRAVTPEQVKAIASKYLGPDEITVGWFVPKNEEGGGPASASPSGQGGAPLGPAVPALFGAAPGRGADQTPPGLLFATGRPGPMDGMGSQNAFDESGDRTAPRPRAGWTAAGPGQPGSGGAKPAAPTGGGAAAGTSFASRTVRRVLPGGTVLLLLPNALSQTVSVRARLRAGSYLDGERPGLSVATADMLERGTKKRGKLEIARQLEAVGSTMTWGAEAYDVVGSGTCLSKNLTGLLETLAEELTQPAFAPDELVKLKEEMKVAILEDEDSTARRAFEQLARVVYPPGHPLRTRTSKERLDALDAFTVEDLRTFHSAHYGASGLVIAVSGNFPADAAEKDLRRLLAGLPARKPVPVEAPRAPVHASGRYPVPMKDKANTDIVLGNAGDLRRTDKDYYAATLANAVLGQSGLSSRLGRQVRDTEGLTYTIVSRFFAPYLLDGPWGIYLSVAPANVDRGIESSTAVLKKFVSEGVSEEELRVEKSAAAGRFQVALANNAGIADALAQAESYGLGISLLDDYPKLVRAVTLDEANRALKAHIHPDALVTVIAGSIGN